MKEWQKEFENMAQSIKANQLELQIGI